MKGVYTRFAKKGKSHLVFYVDATTPATIEASFASIARANEAGESSEEALLWISNLDEEFFLYMDNADDPTVNLRDYFSYSDFARVLITTRRQDAIVFGTGLDSHMNLEPLAVREAVDLLLQTARRPEDLSSDEITVTLVVELYCQPLAVVQAGACMMKSRWTIEHYLEKFRDLRTTFMDGKKDQVNSIAIDDYPLHVYTTWKLSYDRLTEDAQILLQYCAHLHHTGITEDIFHRAFESIDDPRFTDPDVPFSGDEETDHSTLQSFLLRFATSGSWSEDEFRWCIQDACSWSLLSFDDVNNVYSIHPLIHDCLRSVTDSSPYRPFLLAAASRTLLLSNRLALFRLLPHVKRLLAVWDDEQWETIHPSIAEDFSNVLRIAGSPSDAERLGRHAVNKYSDTLGHDHPTTLASKNILGGIYRSLGQYDQAQTVLREILEERRKVLGPDDPKTLISMANVARILFDLERHAEAEPLMKEAMEKTRHLHGADHRDTIWMMSDLAKIFSALQRLTEAEVMEKEVLELSYRVFGPDHPETITAMENLALTIKELERPDEAEPMEKEVLENRRRMLGPDHPETVTAMDNLARTYCELEQPAKAESIQREVLEKRQQLSGPDHPDTMLAMAHLAQTFRDLEQPAEAEPIDREVLESRTRILGPDHPDTVLALAGLVRTLCDLGRHSEVEPLQRELVEKAEHIFGADHPHTVGAKSDLACTLCDLNRPIEAEPIEREVLEKRQQIFGPDHPDTIRAMFSLARTLWDLQRPTEAEPLQRDVVGKRHHLFGPEHPDTVNAIAFLALVLRSQKQYTEVESLERKVLETRVKLLGAEDPATIRAKRNLELTLGLKREAEADSTSPSSEVASPRSSVDTASGSQSSSTQEIRRRALGLDDPATVRTQHNLELTFAKLTKERSSREALDVITADESLSAPPPTQVLESLQVSRISLGGDVDSTPTSSASELASSHLSRPLPSLPTEQTYTSTSPLPSTPAQNPKSRRHRFLERIGFDRSKGK